MENSGNERSPNGGAAFTPHQRAHGLRRKNAQGYRTAKRRERRAPVALAQLEPHFTSEFGMNRASAGIARTAAGIFDEGVSAFRVARGAAHFATSRE
jgi:hypothetical protein